MPNGRGLFLMRFRLKPLVMQLVGLSTTVSILLAAINWL